MRFITPGGKWQRDDFVELWSARELLGTLILRDLKVRYRQAVIGVAWVVLQPLLSLLVFQVFFALLGARTVSESAPYAVTAYAGLLVWQFFAAAARDGANSLVLNRVMLTRVYFPRLLLPAASVGSAGVDFLVAAPLLAGLMLWNQTIPSPGCWMAPAFLLLALAFAASAAVWLSALNALYRDIGYVLPFALQIAFFLSPVIYESTELIPDRWRWIYELNPLSTAITGLRWSLLGTEAPTTTGAGLSTLIVTLLLGTGLLYFRRAEQWISDRV